MLENLLKVIATILIIVPVLYFPKLMGLLA
jgi:hypothetical protein